MSRRELAVGVLALSVAALWVAILTGILPARRGPDAHLPALNATPTPTPTPGASPAPDQSGVAAAPPVGQRPGGANERDVLTAAVDHGDEMEDEPPGYEEARPPASGGSPPIAANGSSSGQTLSVTVPNVPLPKPAVPQPPALPPQIR
jgi:hypothetical protein